MKNELNGILTTRTAWAVTISYYAKQDATYKVNGYFVVLADTFDEAVAKVQSMELKGMEIHNINKQTVRYVY